jgi:hypothetical protein
MSKAMGCLQLEDVIHMLGASIHVYGHSHCPADVELPALVPTNSRPASISTTANRSCRYVHHPLEGAARKSLLCIWDGEDCSSQVCYELDLSTGHRLP